LVRAEVAVKPSGVRGTLYDHVGFDCGLCCASNSASVATTSALTLLLFRDHRPTSSDAVDDLPGCRLPNLIQVGCIQEDFTSPPYNVRRSCSGAAGAGGATPAGAMMDRYGKRLGKQGCRESGCGIRSRPWPARRGADRARGTGRAAPTGKSRAVPIACVARYRGSPQSKISQNAERSAYASGSRTRRTGGPLTAPTHPSMWDH
jgi:hypothetical protein